VKLHIGIDDTDSIKGGCTTYIAALLVERFSQMRIEFTDYPNIIRLNPNVPYKTRGNAAVALRLKVPDTTYEFVRETVLRLVERNSRFGEKDTEPAVVLLRGNPESQISRFSREAITGIVPIQKALRTVKASDGSAVSYGSGLGLVGALAAAGHTLKGDHTFELIAYRKRQNLGRRRLVDEDSVSRMDRVTALQTFNSYDSDNGRVLITPHGPDPVLLGVRGESPEVVVKAFRLLRIHEPIERWVIFRTNHGTDAHLESVTFNQPISVNRPAKLSGIVSDSPERIMGGHVFFTLRYRHGSVRCAAFEPTGKFREIVAKLLPGDRISVFGGVRKHEGDFPSTVNLEKLVIERLNNEIEVENPACPRCGKHMKSAGFGQGFRCKRCGVFARKAVKRQIRGSRTIQTGVYVPDKKAHRHLTKPISRYGLEKGRWNGEPPSGVWHRP
jgi:tRNA(Ile2)-agmatinylcytidine synthase